MDDLISRQAAIDEVREHRAFYCENTPEGFSKLPYEEKCRVDEIDTMWAMLVNLPTAEKRGKWFHQIGNVYACTSCRWHTVMESLFGDAVLYRYCPNCGARMEGER